MRRHEGLLRRQDRQERQACLQGLERVQGQGRVQGGRPGLRRKELLQGKRRLRQRRDEALLQGTELVQEQGRLPGRRSLVRRKKLLQGQGRLRGAGAPQGGVG